VACVACFGDEHEYTLIRDLLRNYDPRLRPLDNASHALNVTFGVALSQIIDVVRTTRGRPQLNSKLITLGAGLRWVLLTLQH